MNDLQLYGFQTFIFLISFLHVSQTFRMQQVLPLGSMSHTVDVAGKAGGLLVQAL